MTIIFLIIFINLITIIFYERKGNSVFNYLLGFGFETDEEKDREKLTKSERNAIIESHMTRKTLVRSSIINLIAFILFLGLMRILLMDYKII